jgi:hypothetical protein
VITVSRVVLLVGVILVILASAGVQFGPLDLFKLGTGVCFASFLLP